MKLDDKLKEALIKSRGMTASWDWSQYHLAVAGGSAGMYVDCHETIHPLPRGGTDLPHRNVVLCDLIRAS